MEQDFITKDDVSSLPEGKAVGGG